MNWGYKPRLNRLLGDDGKCFDVAIDHGFFNELSFLDGIENMNTAVNAIFKANPDAIQLSPGQSHLLQNYPGKLKPALVLRTDIANVYNKSLPSHLFSELIQEPVETALRLDAACAVVNLFLIPGKAELYHQCVKNINTPKVQCDKYALPLMIEPLVMKDSDAGGYGVDGNPEKIIPLVRQAVELGADIIKADPTTDISIYHKVIEVASGRPVLVRGGGKAKEEDILQRTYDLMKQGAKGIVYGRNVIQHPNPTGMTKAFMSIVHENKTPEEALKILKA